MSIAKLLQAAALSAPFLTATPVQANIGPAVGTMVIPKELPAPLPAPELEGNRSRCAMRIVSFFSDENINDIDAALAKVGRWFEDRYLIGPSFSKYKAGTEEGRAFLAKDPGNVIAAIEIYQGHVALMHETAPEHGKLFESTEGKTMNWLWHVSDSTMQGLTQQIATGCRPSL